MDSQLFQDLQDLNDLEESEVSEEFEPQQMLLDSCKEVDITQVAKLRNSSNYINTLAKIRNLSTSYECNEGEVYDLMLKSNNFSFELDFEIQQVFKYLKDNYAPRFKELESLVLNPVDYAKTVELIQNQMDLSQVDLKSILSSATVMVVVVTATTSNGRDLTPVELKRVNLGVQMLLDLEADKKTITEFVQARMNILAPNLTVILGALVSAKLIGIAGGLENLSKIPSCNIMVLGIDKKNSLGFSSISAVKHVGIIYSCDLIKNVPPDYRKKAARVTAGKVALAARIDFAKGSRDGALGMGLLQEISKKIGIMLAPPPGQANKALAVPIEGPKKRRGGKRARKAKEKYGLTELQKAQNKIVFGAPEEEIGYSTGSAVGLGLLGQSNSGKLRIKADSRHKINLSKKYAKKSFGQSNPSGLETSVAFTPIKGIELTNPELLKQDHQKDRYF
jgi:U4/U6 small nuclear ribonucleoprotein PRP31